MHCRTENDARRLLVDAVLTLGAAGLGASPGAAIGWRWSRSGSDGFLVASARSIPGLGDTVPIPVDAIDWFALPLPAGDGRDGAGAVLDVPDGVVGAPDSIVGAPDSVVGVTEAVGAPSDTVVGAPAGPLRPLPALARLIGALLETRPAIDAVVTGIGVDSGALAASAAIQHDGVPVFTDDLVAIAGGPGLRCAARAAPGTAERTAAVVDALADRAGCLVANAGLVAVDRDPVAAVARAVAIERICGQYWRVRLLGDAVLVDGGEGHPEAGGPDTAPSDAAPSDTTPSDVACPDAGQGAAGRADPACRVATRPETRRPGGRGGDARR